MTKSQLRAVSIAAGFTIAILVLVQVLPATPSAPRGTPASILFIGLVLGVINALTAAGLVIVYRTTRIINFAQTAIGAGGAALTFEMLQLTPVPFPVAVLIGLAVAGFLGLLFDLIFGRRFFNAPRLVLTVLTIVAAQFLGQRTIEFIRLLPIFPSLEERPLSAISGAQDLRAFLPFSDFQFQVGAFPLRFGFAELFAIAVGAMVLVAIAALLRYSRMGVAVRAMAENADRAALLGISVGALSSFVWATSGVLSGASVTLAGFVSGPQAALGFAPAVLLPALAASVIARMRSLPIAVTSAILISLLGESLRFRYQGSLPLLDLGLFLVVGMGLLVIGKRMGRAEEVFSSWRATEEIHPVPKELRRIRGLRVTQWILIGVGIAFVSIYPFVTTTGQTNLGGVMALFAIIGLSLVVLTGWAGQVSLAQFAFAAIGAVAGGALTAKVGFPFWVAVPAAALITGGFAALVGIPALRIPGLFLAVSTFAFAVAAHSMLFDERYFGWLLPGAINRPTLFLLDFEDERSMYYLCVAALLIAIVVVVNLRRSRFGRLLIAVRDNEPNAMSVGVSTVAVKLSAFALSGGLAGFAGAIFAHQQRGISSESFSAAANFEIFIQTVLGGIGSVAGALLGSLYLNSVTYLFSGFPIVSTLLVSGGTLYLLYVAPGGLISLLVRLRDAILRIVAQRNQIIVPSLFPNIDAESLRHRMVPLAPPDGGRGTAAWKVTYTLPSVIYQLGRVSGVGEGAEDGDAAALGAAASRAGDEELVRTERVARKEAKT